MKSEFLLNTFLKALHFEKFMDFANPYILNITGSSMQDGDILINGYKHSLVQILPLT